MVLHASFHPCHFDNPFSLPFHQVGAVCLWIPPSCWSAKSGSNISLRGKMLNYQVPSDGATRDMWGEYEQSSKAKKGGDDMFLLTRGIKGWARQETHAEITLLFSSLLAGELCPYPCNEEDFGLWRITYNIFGKNCNFWTVWLDHSLSANEKGRENEQVIKGEWIRTIEDNHTLRDKERKRETSLLCPPLLTC